MATMISAAATAQHEAAARALAEAPSGGGAEDVALASDPG